MKDWDKRLEEAAKKIDLGYWSLNPTPREFEMAKDCYIAGANWAREEMSKENFLAMMSTGLYEAENEIEALRKQCEAMAGSLEFHIERHCPKSFNQSACTWMHDYDELKKALASYRKFMEGFDE